MTPEEQQALVQFFGTMHAQAKQTDQMIVGNSQFVRPVSPVIKQQLEDALRSPVQHNTPPQNYAQSMPLPPIEATQFIPPPHEAPLQHTPVVSNIEVVGNNETVEVLREISLNLARIANILEKKNGPPKRIKNPKSA